MTISGAFAAVRFEQIDRLGEIRVLAQTRAGTMFRPFMRPEVLIGIARLASWPIFLHVGQSSGRNFRSGKFLRCAGIASLRWIRPQSMNGFKATHVLQSQHIDRNRAHRLRRVRILHTQIAMRCSRTRQGQQRQGNKNGQRREHFFFFQISLNDFLM